MSNVLSEEKATSDRTKEARMVFTADRASHGCSKRTASAYLKTTRYRRYPLTLYSRKYARTARTALSFAASLVAHMAYSFSYDMQGRSRPSATAEHYSMGLIDLARP
jgi:hypothetical protein